MRRIGLAWIVVMSLMGAGVASAQFEGQLCWQLFSPPPGLAPFIDVIRCAVTQRPTSPDMYQIHCDDKGFFYHAWGAGSITQYDAIDGLPTAEFGIGIMFTRHVDDFYSGNANCGFTARIVPPELNGPGAFQCSGGPGLPTNVELFIKFKACPGGTLQPPENPPETEEPTVILVQDFGQMLWHARSLSTPLESALKAAWPGSPE